MEYQIMITSKEGEQIFNGLVWDIAYIPYLLKAMPQFSAVRIFEREEEKK